MGKLWLLFEAWRERAFIKSRNEGARWRNRKGLEGGGQRSLFRASTLQNNLPGVLLRSPGTILLPEQRQI